MQQTARAAVLTAPKTFEIREYPIPAIGDDEMLIKVEACGVCGTDGHEYNRDPFGLCPVVLGHEGTGEIVAMGRNITKDTAGNPVALGDKIVTCIIPCGTCDACLNTPARTNLCENVGVYGLMPDDDVHLNGYFGEYLVIRKGSTFFNVSGMTLDQRILVEPAAVVVHSLERAKSTGLLKFNSVVLVQGCGPIGLLQIATLRTLGIETIIAVDGNDSRLELAREMGASRTYNFTRYADLNELLDAVKKDNGGRLADFVFQCTGVGKAILSTWPLSEAREDWEGSDVYSWTENTVTDEKAFFREIDKARQLGYALDNEENEMGVRCIAAAIPDYRGHSFYAISRSAPATRMPDERIIQLRGPLLCASRDIAHALGGVPGR